MKTCFFIGHRNTPVNVYDRLLASVERHIIEYGVTDFVVGRYGNFDHLECVSKMPEAHFRRLWLHFCVDFP